MRLLTACSFACKFCAVYSQLWGEYRLHFFRVDRWMGGPSLLLWCPSGSAVARSAPLPSRLNSAPQRDVSLLPLQTNPPPPPKKTGLLSGLGRARRSDPWGGASVYSHVSGWDVCGMLAHPLLHCHSVKPGSRWSVLSHHCAPVESVLLARSQVCFP